MAGALAALLRAGILPSRRLPDATRVLRISSNAVMTAVRAQSIAGYFPNRRTPKPEGLPAEQARARRPETFPNGSTARKCPSCKQTREVEQFDYVAKGPKTPTQTFAFRSKCGSCHKASMRERYLSDTTRAALAASLMETTGNQVRCTHCGEPLNESHTLPVPYHPKCLDGTAPDHRQPPRQDTASPSESHPSPMGDVQRS